jgi:hypothetical protein
MSEGLEEVPQRIQEDRFSSQDFPSSMERGSTEGTEGTTMLQNSNQVPALMSNMCGIPPR